MTPAQESAVMRELLERIAVAVERIAENTTRRPRRAPGAPAPDPRQLPLVAVDAEPPAKPSPDDTAQRQRERRVARHRARTKDGDA